MRVLDEKWGVTSSGCTHDHEGEDQAQQGEQPPAVDPHQDERRHSIGLDKDLTLEGRCGAAWGVNHRGDFSASTLSLCSDVCLFFLIAGQKVQTVHLQLTSGRTMEGR